MGVKQKGSVIPVDNLRSWLAQDRDAWRALEGGLCFKRAKGDDDDDDDDDDDESFYAV